MSNLLVAYPFVTSWTWVANLLSILLVHPETQPWIFSNYVTLLCEKDRRNPNALYIDYAPRAAKQLDVCPWIYNQSMLRSSFKVLVPDLRTFIREALLAKNYIYMLIDQKYIQECKNERLHETLIFGYDETNGLCDIADFTFSNSGRYSFIKTNIANILNGNVNITEKNDYMESVHLLKFKPEAEYSFETEWLKTCLRDYQKAENPYKHYKHMYCMHKGLGYGSAIYDIIIEDVNKSIRNNECVNIQTVHNFYDHKVFMLKRVEYLLENSILKSETTHREAQKMVKLADTIRFSALRYNLRRQTGWENTFCKAMLELKNIENNVMNELLYGL